MRLRLQQSPLVLIALAACQSPTEPGFSTPGMAREGDTIVLSSPTGALRLRTARWCRALAGTGETTIGEESWAPAGSTGWQQAWHLPERPGGDGALWADLGLDARVDAVAGTSARLRARDGSTWRVDGLAALDAGGRALPLALSVRQGSLWLSVDDAGAAYPISIDPVYTSAAWTATGTSTYTGLGISVAGAGDVNGDGLGDFVVGGHYASASRGTAQLYLGASSGPGASADQTWSGGATGDLFGTSVAGAGDVNGDGWDDVLVGAPGYGAAEGAAYLYSGSAAGPSAAASTTLLGTTSYSSFGAAVAGIGDVNGDGFDDVAVGAYQTSSNTGEVLVYLGSAAGLSSTASVTIAAPSAGIYFGESVAGAGDIDGDGYDELLVGARGYGGGVGRAYLFAGSSTGVASTARWTYSGTTSNENVGSGVAGLGDIDGDGLDDVGIGARGYSSFSGRVYVFHGSAAGLPSAANTTLSGTASSGYFGQAITGLGDLDGDGHGEVAVGAPYASTYAGAAYVFEGSSTGLGTTAVATIAGSATAQLGTSVASPGDTDGDGANDLLVGAVRYGTWAGQASLYRGYGDNDADGVLATDDCDDNDAAVGTATTLYVDGDGDGYGGTTTGTACEGTPGFSGVATDCDDASAEVSPGALEVCDSAAADEDCDGLVDENDPDVSTVAYYDDADGDGYGDGARTVACEMPTGTVANDGDCDDTRPDVSPGGTEVCDALDADEDCDGLADEADPDAVLAEYFADLDNDGYGSGTATAACDVPVGRVTNDLDCDDGNASVSPEGAEVCDSLDADEDCDNASDEADADTPLVAFYADADGDGHGAGAATLACDAPAGWVSDATDCDDARADVSPTAAEVCDAANADEDCDGLVEESDPDTTLAASYADEDGDGHGVGAATWACDKPAGRVATAGDCDDARADVSPDGVEVCDDSDTDEDCDGQANDLDDDVTETTAFYADADGDGYGSGTAVEACEPPGGTADEDGDCDDADAARYPGAPEPDCTDPNDYNCDGSVGYADDDGDGYAACEECDDQDAGSHPDATEYCDGLDNDCNGEVDDDAVGGNTYYPDADGDEFVDLTVGIYACEAPDGYVEDLHGETDCDDSDPSVYPHAPEMDDDGIDQDCDGADRHDNSGAGRPPAQGDKTFGCRSTSSAPSWDPLVVALTAMVLVSRPRRAWPRGSRR